MGRSLTRKQTLDLVETTLRTEGWSMLIADRLGAQSGYARSTLYRMRDEVLDTLADENAADLPRRRARMLLDIARIRERAVDSDKPAAAARLLGMEAQMMGLDQPQPVESTDDGADLDTTPEGMLAEVRGMRKAAQRGGSHVAAAKLLELEAGLVTEIAEAARAKAERERAASDSGALEDRMVAALKSMPDALLRKVMARVQEGE